MKSVRLLRLMLFSGALLLSQRCIATLYADPRVDSFNVKKYIVHIDVTDFKNGQIKGYTDVEFTPLLSNLSYIRLDLYRMIIDSVSAGGLKLAYQYNDSLLHINFVTPLNSFTDNHLQIYYHGKPSKDPKGFGGFAFDNSDSGYAYNLGISLNLKPHTFGRGWFPCVDDFTHKALFEFFITTLHNHKAFCNGLLLDSTLNPDNTWQWHWSMLQIIPPYLASVASGNYVTLYRTYNTPARTIPLICAVPYYDTSAFRSSFSAFYTAVSGFENRYGPYHFDRAGYFGMPFGGGAMEHATNIALPNLVYTYSAYNFLWAHELSHHWWGDYMTCASAEEMWLNEGWASFSESIFEENLSGKKAYINYARSTHYQALRYAHIADKGYRAISPMPQDYTYGPTIYEKGADAVHTLRSYLGDSLFFTGCKAFLDTFAWRNATSEDFRRVWTKTTGKDSLVGHFINEWILNPGFTHFEIDSSWGNDNTSFGLRIRQRLSHAPSLFKYVPLTVSYFDSAWKRTDIQVNINGPDATLLSAPFIPVFIGLDIDGKIADATTKEYKVINTKGATYTYNESLMTLKINAVTDSALIYVVHHWIAPDRGDLPSSIKLSTERYWTVDGIIRNEFDATATINYDGSSPAAYTQGGYLDNALLSGYPEDSLRLMYRPDAQSKWKEYPDYKKITGIKSDKYGTISINHLKKGQYTFAISGLSLGINEKKPHAGEGVSIYPNPANDYIIVQLSENSSEPTEYNLYDLSGNMVYITKFEAGRKEYRMNVSKLASGTYVLKGFTKSGNWEKKIIIRK